MSVALVTGARGQDGSYLVERLLAEGVEVHGLVRREDLDDDRPDGLVTHEVDLDSPPDVLVGLVDRVAPDELYHLGGLSSVARSWEDPLLATRVNGLAALALMDAARRLQERRGREVRQLGEVAVVALRQLRPRSAGVRKTHGVRQPLAR